MNLKKKLQTWIWVLVGVSILLGWMNASPTVIQAAQNLIVGFMIGAITSAVAGKLVESLTGDVLKKWFLNVEIYGFDFSISVFAIVTFLVELWLF